MESKKIAAVLVLAVFISSLTACAAAPVKTETKPQKFKTAKQIKFEQEEETRSLWIKSISSFSGLVAGGLIGLLTSKKENAVSSSIGGCVAGGVLGFGLGMLIFENTKPSQTSVDDGRVKEYFQDYRNIQLKD